MPTGEKPLSGITVVSFAQVVAGPICTTFLADLGADVIKIETPQDGEPFRRESHEINGEGFNMAFEVYNRNKRSLTVDLKSDRGLDIVHDLIREADMVVENFAPGVAESLSIDYDTLSELNSDIIYVSIKGYDTGGPMADRPAFDSIIQHVSGVSSLHPKDGDRPITIQIFLSDFFAGYNAALSGLGALYHRQNGGGGQKCDITLFHSLVHNMNVAYEKYLNLDVVNDPEEDDDDPDLIYGTERTKDGWIGIACIPIYPHTWGGFCELLDKQELMDHPEYRTPADRREDETIEELNSMMRNWLLEHTSDEAIEQLNEHGIPAGPHNTISAAAEMDHVSQTGMMETVEHPRLGPLQVTDSPLDLSETNPLIQSLAPQLGEHNIEILTNLGYSDEDIARLEEDGIL